MHSTGIFLPINLDLNSVLINTLRRSLEEQMYLERYGLLRPGSSANAAIPPYPPMGYPSYLNFRYPAPMIPPSDLNLSLNNEATLNR